MARVYIDTAAVIAMAWITFSVLVGQATAHGLHYFIANEVFTSDKLHAA